MIRQSWPLVIINQLRPIDHTPSWLAGWLACRPTSEPTGAFGRLGSDAPKPSALFISRASQAADLRPIRLPVPAWLAGSSIVSLSLSLSHSLALARPLSTACARACQKCSQRALNRSARTSARLRRFAHSTTTTHVRRESWIARTSSV